MNLETRALKRKIEVRAENDGGRKVGGYAAVFNAETDIGGVFREKIAPGAFAKAITGDVRALVNHDPGRVIGRTTAGTLRLSEDATGLAVEIDLPDTSDGRDLAVSIERGDISGMSFGFVVTREEWDQSHEPPVRTIQEVELFEVSAVAFPAYEETAIALRSLDAARAKERAADNFLARRRRLAMRKARAEQRFRGI